MAIKSCPRCGLKETEVLKGKAGCPKCFTVFRPQIKAFLNTRFGAFAYAGEPYVRDPEGRDLLNAVEDMKAELEVALSQEDYEEAARIRDRIQQIKQRLRSEF